MRPDPWLSGRERSDTRRARTTLVLAVLTAVTVMTLDAGTGDRSPVEPVRAAVGEVFGPVQSAASEVTDPVVDAVDALGDLGGLRADNERLEVEVARLRAELATDEVDRNRLAQYDALAGVTEGSGFELVAARVVAMGPAQAFTRTATIDAGSGDGVEPDMTVVEAGGLVGRVLRTDRHTATVLLVVDAESFVGGRLGRSMELGFLQGSGDLGDDGLLAMDLVDPTVVPAAGDTVVTWGSRGGAPYVSGVPVGQVVDVQSSAGDQSVTTSIAPFADMSSLDLVGVVVGAGPGSRSELSRVPPGGGS